MNKINQILILGLLVHVGVGSARDLSLPEALEVAADKNISIQQATNNTEVSKNTASLASAGLLPRVDWSTSTTITDATTQTVGGELTTTSSRNTAGLNASYTVFKGLQGMNSYKLLRSQASAAELQEIMTTENTLMAVARSYYSLLMNHDNLEILRDQMDVSRERLEQALDKNARGMSSSLQALAARVDFDSDSTSILEAEYAYQEARRSLNLILGWDINKIYEPVRVDRKFGEYDPRLLQNIGLKSNTSYLLNQNFEGQSQLNLNKTLGTVLPTVSFTGKYGLSQINPDVDLALDNADIALSGELSLTWNLFDGRKTKSLQSARILKKNSELNTLDAKRSLMKDVESAYGSYIKSLQVLELKQTNLESAQLNFEQTREFFLLGQVGSTQFRDSQINLSRVKSSLIQAKYSAYLDEMNIWLLTGQLQEKI